MIENKSNHNDKDKNISKNNDINMTGGKVKNTKTPFYQAIHSSRYLRQDLIAKIQYRNNRRLICYIGGIEAGIDREDTVGFVDLLHNIPKNSNIDLFLHTIGGDINVAEKIIVMIRKKVGTKTLRVIVPDFAKSSGTLMALGADIIVMSDSSELGPIDPQIIRGDENGNRIPHAIQSYLDAYKYHSGVLTRDPSNITSRIMLQKLDPATVKLFESVMARARKIAEVHLQRGMFRNKGNWSKAAAELIDTKRWPSHAQMISWEDAQDPRIGLIIEYLDPNNEEWIDYWRLYCLQRLAVKDRQKLFESDITSICIDGNTA